VCGFILSLDDANFDLRTHCQSIVHRGPSSTKYYSDTRLKCGFNRLAIVDLDSQSDQPMIDKEQGWLLLFNGEIYNYRSLRAELEARYGYRFKTKSDTEVLMAGLGFEGRSFATKLNGIFAFVFVNLNDYSILAGRDAFGVKPLYYSKGKSVFYFCSESKPLAHLTGASIDRKSLALLLASGSTTMGGAIYTDVFSVAPNEIIEIRKNIVAEYEISNMKFWESDEDIAEENIIAQIESAANRQRPDVQFGLQLSGGIDSTLLLSMLHKSEFFAGTYSVNVDDAEMSEKYWQEIALNHYGAEKSSREVSLGIAEFQIDKLREVVVGSDVPYFHPSFVGAAQMSKLANDDGLKVLISGEGADEIFLGYKWFFEEEPIQTIFEYSPLSKLSKFLGVIEPDMSFLNSINRLEFFQKWYLQRWLARSDLTGMRHSIEVRVPFLDLELVKMVNGLDRGYKTKFGPKWILKNYLLKKLPKAFVHRRKRGFDFPLNSWIQDNHINFLKANKDLFEIDDGQITRLQNSCDFRDKRLIFSLCSFALWRGR
jgi:asparagine synthase (glutamine-hydrolysing)